MIKNITEINAVLDILRISNKSASDGDKFAQYPSGDFYESCISNGYIFGNYINEELVSFCYLGPDLREKDVTGSSIDIDNNLHIGCLMTSVDFRGCGYGAELLLSMPSQSWMRIDPINERSKAAALSGGYSVVGDCLLISGSPVGNRLILQKILT